MSKPIRSLWILGVSLALAGAAMAQGDVNTPRVHALTHVHIVSAPGQVIEDGTIVIRDGLIEAVGASITPPADARIWEKKDLWVYPGLVDLALEVPSPKSEGKGKGKEAGKTTGHELSVVKADRSMAEELSLKKSTIESYRNAGILTARVFPGDGVFRGRAAVLNLGDGRLGKNLLEPSAGQVLSFKGNRREGYPGSIMGVVAVIRQTLSDAAWYESSHTLYNKSPRGLERPNFNAALEALVPAIQGKESFFFITDDVLDVMRADAIAQEFGVTFHYLGSGQEYRRLPEVETAAGDMIVPVSFPKSPSVGTDPGKNLQVNTRTLRHWDMAPSNPSRVYEAGVQMALTATGLKNTEDFRKNVAKAIDAGLPRDAALAACTTIPAAMAGLTDQVGRIEKGLLANLVITDGELFTDSTSVNEVWVDGDRYEVEAKEPPEGDPRGRWDYTVHVEGMEMPGTLSITGEIGALAASIGMNEKTIEATCTQSGKTFTVTFDGGALGFPGTIRMSFRFEGDTADGSGTSAMGEFTLTATRVEPYEEPSGMKGAR